MYPISLCFRKVLLANSLQSSKAQHECPQQTEKSHSRTNSAVSRQVYVHALLIQPGSRLGGRGGGNAPGRHFWSKEGIANDFSRMNLKLDLGFRFCLRLDLPYV